MLMRFESVLFLVVLLLLLLLTTAAAARCYCCFIAKCNNESDSERKTRERESEQALLQYSMYTHLTQNTRSRSPFAFSYSKRSFRLRLYYAIILFFLTSYYIL